MAFAGLDYDRHIAVNDSRHHRIDFDAGTGSDLLPWFAGNVHKIADSRLTVCAAGDAAFGPRDDIGLTCSDSESKRFLKEKLTWLNNQ